MDIHMHNNDLFNILEEDDNLITSEDPLKELQVIVSQIRRDHESTMQELSDLRKAVYTKIEHLSEKAIGDYAEISFAISQKYIKKCGVLIFMADLLRSSLGHIPEGHFLRMLPSIKTVEDRFVVTLLCTSTCDVNFSKITSNIAYMFDIEEKVLLIVKKQIDILDGFEFCLDSFEKDYAVFMEEPQTHIYFEADDACECIVKEEKMPIAVM